MATTHAADDLTVLQKTKAAIDGIDSLDRAITSDRTKWNLDEIERARDTLVGVKPTLQNRSGAPDEVGDRRNCDFSSSRRRDRGVQRGTEISPHVEQRQRGGL